MALVLGGLGSRLDLPVDRIDELALAAVTAGGSALGATLELELEVLDDLLRVRVGPLEEGSTADAARQRVLKPLVDGVAAVRKAGHEWIELELARGATG